MRMRRSGLPFWNNSLPFPWTRQESESLTTKGWTSPTGIFPTFSPSIPCSNSIPSARRIESCPKPHSNTGTGSRGGKALAGYSFTGGAALYAALGMGSPALEMLQNFLDGKSPASRLHSNTFYTESGGKNPVIETPLSAASATMDLLLQSWGRKIRVFPAVPEEWKEATFRDLRAEGGFLVSAARYNGQTDWVRIQSEAGEPCILKVPDWRKSIDWLNEDGNCEHNEGA